MDVKSINWDHVLAEVEVAILDGVSGLTRSTVVDDFVQDLARAVTTAAAIAICCQDSPPPQPDGSAAI